MADGGKARSIGRSLTDRRGAEVFAVRPFNRLARTHGFSIAGDTLVTIALADSLFFSIDPNDARWRVGLYLLLTMAPFAVVAPFLGPLMDRLQGGHRAMIIATSAARAVLAVLIARNIDGLALFPLAFGMLVLGKTYAIARSALVPSIVGDESALVGANSRLSLLSAVAGAAAAVPGALLLRFGGSAWVLGLATLVFVVGAVLALRIPAVQVADHRADALERAELRQAGILLAASGMGYLRGVVGFLAMLLAFALRGGVDPGPTGDGVALGHRLREALGLDRLDLATGGAPAWHFGVVLVGVGVGGLLGAVIAPRLRAHVREEAMLTGVLTGTAAMALLAAIAGGLVGSFVAALAVATAAAAGKQAFDAIVQRDAPEANLGRSFSRFETRFQMIWVIGALFPVVLPIPARLGFVLVAVTAAFAAFTVYFGRSPLTRLQVRFAPQLARIHARADRSARRAAGRWRRRGSPPPPSPPPGDAPAAPARGGGLADDDPTDELPMVDRPGSRPDPTRRLPSAPGPDETRRFRPRRSTDAGAQLQLDLDPGPDPDGPGDLPPPQRGDDRGVGDPRTGSGPGDPAGDAAGRDLAPPD